MDGEHKELPAARRRRLLRQLSKVVRASLGTCLMGTLFTFPSVLASDLEKHPTSLYGTSLSMQGLQDLVGSLLMLSSLPGAWLTAAVAFRLGRRRSMMLCGGVGVLGWLGVALIPYSAGILASRCVSGLALGGLSVVVNAYVAELSDDDVRGMMSMSLNLAILLGQVFTVAVGYGVRYYVVSFVNAFVPAFFVLFLVWLPESPSVLVLKDEDEKAKEVLLELRGSNADIETEIESYKSFNAQPGEEEGEGRSAWRKLMQRDVAKNLLVVCVLFVLVAFSGFVVVNANATQMFQLARTTVDPELAAIVLMLVQFAGGFAGFFLMDKIGRKNILYLGFILMTLGFGGMATYCGLKPWLGVEYSYVHYEEHGGGGGGGEGRLLGGPEEGRITLTPTPPHLHHQDTPPQHHPSSPPLTTYSYTTTNTTNTSTINFTLPVIEEVEEMESAREGRREGERRGKKVVEEKEGEAEWMEVEVAEWVGGWVPLACLVASQTGASLGANVMPFILNQEYFPTAIRSQACGVGFTAWTLATFTVLQMYTPMVTYLTQAGLYGFYGAICLLGLPFTAYCVKETMGEAVG